jgi:GntR family transcriptional regulator
MRIALDVHGGVPTFRQIVDQIRFLIDAGQLPGGSELPSTRSLAQQLGINPMTVSKAYGLLEAEGLLLHRAGLPLTVRPRLPHEQEEAREAQLRAALVPAAQMVRQLGVSPTKAAQLFKQVLLDLERAEEEQ